MIKQTFHWADIFIYSLLIGVALVTLLPFIYIISVSFTSDYALSTYGGGLWPKEFSLEGYRFIFQKADRLLISFKNSIIITVGGTILSLVVTAGMAYPLSRKYLPYRSILMKYVVITMLFSGGLIPFYLVIKNLNMIDTLWAVILPGAVNAFYMILMRNFFGEIPIELEESALIDGANELKILFRIFLPISTPVLATIALYYAVGYWNNWFGPLLFLNDLNLWPLIMLLKQVVQSPNAGNAVTVAQNSAVVPSESVKMAVVVIASLPIIIVYPMLQRFFVQGIVLGSVKG